MLNKINFKEFPKGLGIDRLIDFIVHSRPYGRITDYPNSQDLYELLALDEVRGQTIMWLDDAGDVRAFCMLDPYNNLLFECVDTANYSPLFKFAAEFCGRIIKDNNKEMRNYPTLDASCWGNDHQRLNCLKKESFQPEPIVTVYFKR